MNGDTPKDQPDITLTPVEFSPSQPPDSLEPMPPAPPKPPMQFPVFIPLLIILVTLIFSTTRDTMAVKKRLAAIDQENAPTLEGLKDSGKKVELVESLRNGLQKLSQNDPVAAGILKDYFGSASAVKPDNANGPAKAPAK